MYESSLLVMIRNFWLFAIKMKMGLHTLSLLIQILPLLGMIYLASPARADRDIVYSARYYLRPGSRGYSHFHIYRINSDGARKLQLTYGKWDDTDPVWSPDGRKILFTRSQSWRNKMLYLMGAGGGAVTKLMALEDEECHYRWSPDSRTISVSCKKWVDTQPTWTVFLIDAATRKARRLSGASGITWSPDGARSYVSSDKRADKIIHCKSGKVIKVKDRVLHPVWLTESTIVGIEPGSTELSAFLRVISMDSKQKKRIHLMQDKDFIFAPQIYRIPSDTHSVIFKYDASFTSNIGIAIFFRVNIATGAMRPLAEGYSLAWSPRGTYFCTNTQSNTAPYERPKDGRQRMVWVSSLQIVSAKGGKLRNIVSGLVWVDGCDWRKLKH